MRAVVSLVAALVLCMGTEAWADEVVVEHEHPSPAGVVVRDTAAGAVVGAAVGGGILLVRNQWSTGTFLSSVGIGLLAGVGVGFLDATLEHTWGDRVAVNNTELMPPVSLARAEVDSARMAKGNGLPPGFMLLQQSHSF